MLGECDPNAYPLQLKNKPSLEYLREKAHLRFRTNTFGAVFRVRHTLAYAIHKFFNDKGFVYMHTPIVTASDAEGAGEMFRVTTLPFDGAPRNEDGTVDFREDFFGRSTNLTAVSYTHLDVYKRQYLVVLAYSPPTRATRHCVMRKDSSLL